MQKGKISKTLESLVARTTFNTLRSNCRNSYKDRLFLEIISIEGSVAYGSLASRLQDWQLFQLRLRVEQRIATNTTIEAVAPEEYFRNYIQLLADRYQDVKQITTLHALYDIAMDSSTALHNVLALYNITPDQLREANVQTPIPGSNVTNWDNSHDFQILDVNRQLPSRKSTKPKGNHPLDKYGVNLTRMAQNGEIDPVIGRSTEIDRVIEILSRRKKNNPILIGEAGVGKSAIAEGLALKIVSGDVPYSIAEKTLFSLDISSLIAGTKFRGEFEERIQQLLDALRKSNDTIIFIDEIHTIVGAGSTQGSLDTANILKPALARGELQVIGATTLDEYRTDIESDAALERRFQKVIINPTSEEDTLEILRKIAPQYEKHHRVKYSEEAIKACVSLSARYITDRYFPDKAIDILDEVGARTHLRSVVAPSDLKELEEALVSIKQERADALEESIYDRAAEARLHEITLGAKLKERREEWQEQVESSPIEISVVDVESVITSMTGVPAERLSENETLRLQNMQGHLERSVVGQKEAVIKLSKSIYRSRAGLRESNKPIGVFMFVGPTGVGKTLLAKELSKWLFDDKRGLIRIDMSEYGEKHNVSRLIGSPPGYIGYGEGGQLTEAVRRQPYSVILLDEIEKAHPEVFNSMLQIFDEGHLTDGSGRKVDFRNTIIIMTSNVGSRKVVKQRNLVGYSTIAKGDNIQQRPKTEYRKALEQTFAPEFINRIDDVVVFRSLTLSDVEQIIDIELDALKQRIEALGYKLRITSTAKRTLATLGYHSEYGARALRRTLADKIEEPLSTLIVDGHLRSGDTVVVEKVRSEVDNVRLKVA